MKPHGTEWWVEDLESECIRFQLDLSCLVDGEMDEVATRSRFRVRVFAGTLRQARGCLHEFRPSADEIAEIVEFPVAALRDPASLRVETHWQGGALSTVYSYAHDKHLVFGATARILQQFLQLLEDGLESEGQN